jgi:tetratricopeptide (TPR) repeat protein
MTKRNALRLLLFIPLALWGAAMEGPGHSRLEFCISDYKDGDYQKAADSLQVLLPLLSDPEDQVEAYKYLGFSYGMLNRIEKSKTIFKTVLEKFPGMDIDTLEVPPNIAIIFKQAKLERKIETIDTLNSAKPRIVVQKRNIVAPVLLLTGAILSAGAGGNLFYYGNQQYQKYKSLDNPDQNALDRYYSDYRNSYIAGAACAGVSAVLLPVSLYLFMKKDHGKKDASVSFINGCPSLVFVF